MGKLPAPSKLPSNDKMIIFAWWAREDSNLQPSGYERATLPEKVSDYWHFRAGSATFVRVWLRRIIGYLLVGPGTSLRAPKEHRPDSNLGQTRSMGERPLHTGEVVGSIPTAPTT
jgi:hypothetical protein